MAHDKTSGPDLQGVTVRGPGPFPPASATVRVEFGARSHIGSLHEVNEDHYAIIELGRHQETLLTSLPEAVIPKRFEEYGYGMVVADGFGGEGAGETASRLAIATLMHLLLHFGKWNLRIVDDRIAQEVLDRAERFYRHVDSTVFRHDAGVEPRLQTSLTATFGAGRDLFFAHVGHSRAYLFREGNLLRLTRDHTIGRRGSTKVPVAPLMDVNAAAQDLKHIITDTIGMRGSLGPMIDLERFRLSDEDRVLVCTNGLTDLVEEEAMAEVLGSKGTADDCCRTLVNLALAAGGEDDVTALVAAYHIPD